MVLYKIYSQEHRIRYFAHPCSTAIVFQIICLILTFLPPLFTSYFTSGFYYKELTYHEQPNVVFLRRYNVIIEGTTTTPIFSSSDPLLNSYFTDYYLPSSLSTSIPRDVNNDGVIDQQTLSIEQSIDSALTLKKNLELWLFFRYTLNRYPTADMETLGRILLSAPSAISNYKSVTIFGQLRFHQRDPILTYQNISTLQGSVINYTNIQATPSLNRIYNDYLSRNYFTSFETEYVQWSPSSSPPSSALTIKVVVNVGSQAIRYVPNFWKEFRWTWIQYVTSLLPFYYLANKIKEFVFSKKLVRTFVKQSS